MEEALEQAGSADLIQLLQQQMEHQRKMLVTMRKQWMEDREQFERLLLLVTGTPSTPVASTVSAVPPTFPPFDSTSELWTDYYALFYTFVGDHLIPEEKVIKVFLTNQSTSVSAVSESGSAADTTKRRKCSVERGHVVHEGSIRSKAVCCPEKF